MKYLIMTKHTVTRRFVVDADSAAEAAKLVRADSVALYAVEETSPRVVADWPLADQALPAGNVRPLR